VKQPFRSTSFLLPELNYTILVTRWNLRIPRADRSRIKKEAKPGPERNRLEQVPAEGPSHPDLHGDHGPALGVTQLASGLSLNKTTVHRLLNAMEKFDLIERNPEGDRYRLGLKLHELGTRAVESRTLRTEAHRFLLELSRASHETVSLAVPGPGGVLCLDRVDSRDSIITVRTPSGRGFLPTAQPPQRRRSPFCPRMRWTRSLPSWD